MIPNYLVPYEIAKKYLQMVSGKMATFSKVSATPKNLLNSNADLFWLENILFLEE